MLTLLKVTIGFNEALPENRLKKLDFYFSKDKQKN